MIKPLEAITFVYKQALVPVFQNLVSNDNAWIATGYTGICVLFVYTPMPYITESYRHIINEIFHPTLTILWIMMMFASLERSTCRWGNELLRTISPALDYDQIKAVINPGMLEVVVLRGRDDWAIEHP